MEIKTIWNGQMEFTTTNPGGKLVTTDAAKSSGGRGQGQTPAELMLSALAGCMGISMMTAFQNYKEEVKDLSISVEGIKGEGLPNRIEKINLTIDIKTAIPKERVEKIIHLSHDKYCTVSNTLSAEQNLVINYQSPQ